MNARTDVATLPALAMNESQLVTVLENSLYPGAQSSSIALVINYCRAAGLDPMMKPVHIVPMWDNKANRLRDVIMPGIGLYRTQAARSGQYAGVTEPEFGPDVTEKVDGVEITYPAWCRVTAKRAMANGTIAEFSAVERWKENYAVKGGKEKSIAPNSMWMRRPYAQLAKCAGAQALRIAFPELTGAQPTADEMEGKHIEEEVIEGTAEREPEKRDTALKPYPTADFDKNFPTWKKLILSDKKSPEQIITTVSSKAILSDGQKAAILAVKKPEPTDTDTGETESLMDQVKRICAAALEIADRDTAFTRLQDAEAVLPEMNSENKSLARTEIDAAIASIKARE